MKTNQSGFTLVELLIVMIIMGVLAAFVAPKFMNLSSTAERSTLKLTAEGITDASELNQQAAKSAQLLGLKAGKDYYVIGNKTSCSKAVKDLLGKSVPKGMSVSGKQVGNNGNGCSLKIGSTSQKVKIHLASKPK